MFQSNRATVAKGGMHALKKGFAEETFEEILDNSAGHSSTTSTSEEETKEEVDSLRDKIHDEHMNEIENKKGKDVNFFSQHQSTDQ